MNTNSRRPMFPRTLSRWAVAGLAILIIQDSVLAQQGLLDGLARPSQGRSMRSTSTFRKGADGKYDPPRPSRWAPPNR